MNMADMIDPFTRARARLSTPVNGVWTPFNVLPKTLHRFCAPAFFHNEGEPTYDLSFRGSALLARFKGKNFAVFTRHQLGRDVVAVEAADFTIGLDDQDGRKVGLTPTAITSVKVSSREFKNVEDLQICEYEDERNGRDLRRLFLNLDLDETLETVPQEAVQAIFLMGYPTGLNEVEIEGDDRDDIEVTPQMTMRLRWVKIYLERAPEPDLWDTDNRIILVPHPDAPTTLADPDGLSGGPAFFIWMDPTGQARLGLAGLVTNARADRFAIYSTAYIRTALQQCIGQEVDRSL